MYYLSRMALNGRRRNTAELLSNPQKMHATVESCFYSGDVDQNPRSLWRLERHQHRVTLWTHKKYIRYVLPRRKIRQILQIPMEISIVEDVLFREHPISGL